VNLSACERILVVKPSSLGDIVHTLPAAAAIHRAAPDAKIDWLVNTEWKPLLEGVPFLDRILEFPRREFRGLSGLFRARSWVGQTLGSAAYDLALDFQGLFRSAYLARRSGGCSVGFRRSREGARWFYDRSVEVSDWDRCHAVDRNLSLASALGAAEEAPCFPLPPGTAPTDLPPLPEAPVVLHPFSRGAGKSLSIREVRELTDLLAPHPVVVVGTPAGTPQDGWSEHVVDLSGKTSLSELIYVLRLAAWTVSVDSGPMHLASGITDRVLSIHTWSNPAMVGQYPANAWIFRESRLVRVGDLDPAEFPERRDLAARYDSRDRLLETDDIEAIAAFLLKQIAR